jgi:membrane-associated phospholipid phosphatase
MFETTIDDFRRLPSQDTLMVLSIGGAIAAAGRPRDWDVTHGFSRTGSRSTYQPGATIGGARAQIAGALGTYAVGRLIRNKRVAGVGSDLIRAQLVAQTITAGIKLSARRHRPDGDEFSFPSGHSSVTFATATVLQRNFGWKAGVPAYALASYVAASRVHMKRHFFSDVAFGAAIGIVAGRTVTEGRGPARFAVSPTVSPNQAGVSFVLLDNR